MVSILHLHGAPKHFIKAHSHTNEGCCLARSCPSNWEQFGVRLGQRKNYGGRGFNRKPFGEYWTTNSPSYPVAVQFIEIPTIALHWKTLGIQQNLNVSTISEWNADTWKLDIFWKLAFFKIRNRHGNAATVSSLKMFKAFQSWLSGFNFKTLLMQSSSFILFVLVPRKEKLNMLFCAAWIYAFSCFLAFQSLCCTKSLLFRPLSQFHPFPFLTVIFRLRFIQTCSAYKGICLLFLSLHCSALTPKYLLSLTFFIYYAWL